MKEFFDPLFETFWDMYGKKVAKSRAIAAWKKLTVDERQGAVGAVASFVAATPEIRFRPYPSSYLLQKRWNDDFVTLKSSNQSKSDPFKNVFNEKRDKYYKDE